MSGIDGLPCSHHIDDRMPYFKESDVHVRMITSLFATKTTENPQSRIVNFHPGEIRNLIRARLKRKVRNPFLYRCCFTILFLPLFPLYILMRIVLPRHDNTIWWSLSAFVAAVWHCMIHRPDILYSTGGSNSAHLAAAWTSRITRVPWVAEFQDPLIHGYYCKSKAEGKFIHWLEKTVMTRADRVVFLTDGARKAAEQRTGQAGKGYVIHSGGDPGLFDSIQPPDGDSGKLTFSHLGSLLGTRNPGNFLQAVKQLIEKNALAASDIEFKIVGGSKDSLKMYLDEFPYQDILTLVEKVPRYTALEMMVNAGVLLLVQNQEPVSSETIPSKVYEYLLAGRPILGLIYRNPELSEILLQRGHYIAEADDIEGIEDQILIILEKWKNRNLLMQNDARAILIQDSVKRLVVLIRDHINKSEIELTR